jgi:hypothetical protein
MNTRMDDFEFNEFKDSNESNNDRAPFDEYTLFEIEHDNHLHVIHNFKKLISSEPEFCGIYSISSFKILDIFKNSNKLILKNDVLTKNQVGMFKSVYYEIFKERPTELLIHKIGYNIISDIYI